MKFVYLALVAAVSAVRLPTPTPVLPKTVEYAAPGIYKSTMEGYKMPIQTALQGREFSEFTPVGYRNEAFSATSMTNTVKYRVGDRQTVEARVTDNAGKVTVDWATMPVDEGHGKKL